MDREVSNINLDPIACFSQIESPNYTLKDLDPFIYQDETTFQVPFGSENSDSGQLI